MRTFLKTVSLLALVFCIVSLIWHQVDFSPMLFHAVWKPEDTGAPIMPVIAGLIGVAAWMVLDLIGD